jgi:hypothetical protein
MSLEF